MCDVTLTVVCVEPEAGTDSRLTGVGIDFRGG